MRPWQLRRRASLRLRHDGFDLRRQTAQRSAATEFEDNASDDDQPDSPNLRMLHSEYKVLRSLQPCEHVVRLIGWHHGLVMEYVPMSVLSFMNHLITRQLSLSNTKRIRILTGALHALRFLHEERHLVHRDVKAERICWRPLRGARSAATWGCSATTASFR